MGNKKNNKGKIESSSEALARPRNSNVVNTFILKQDKIEQLKEQISNGSYRVNISEVATRFIEEELEK